MTNRPAVVLVSGGLDSATALAIAVEQGFDVTALSVHYGQRHALELSAAVAVATRHGVKHVESRVELFGGSALTAGAPLPTSSGGIPATYVPARNTVLLSLALSLAEVVGAQDIFIGANAVDYSGYPDCRPEYIEAYERMANLATKAAIDGRRLCVHAPLIGMTKGEIISHGLALGVDYALTSSCYDPSEAGACGVCDSCSIRLRGFADAGISDPISYRA